MKRNEAGRKRTGRVGRKREHKKEMDQASLFPGRQEEGGGGGGGGEREGREKGEK